MHVMDFPEMGGQRGETQWKMYKQQIAWKSPEPTIEAGALPLRLVINGKSMKRQEKCDGKTTRCIPNTYTDGRGGRVGGGCLRLRGGGKAARRNAMENVINF